MKNFILGLIALLILFSCQEDDFDNHLTGISEFQGDMLFLQQFGGEVSRDFIGEVKDENGLKLKNVQIQIGSITTFTDYNGVFIINDAIVREHFAYIKAVKEGYQNGLITIVPTATTNNIKITLLEKEILTTISSGTATEVTLPNGTKIEFSGDFVDEEGATYMGMIDVSLNYMNPQNTTVNKSLTTTLGQAQDNRVKYLNNLGVVELVLYGSSGELLKVGVDHPTLIRIPVTPTNEIVPHTINLWYFDDLVGYWKIAGDATRVGNYYEAALENFSLLSIATASVNEIACVRLMTNNNVLPNHLVEFRDALSGMLIYSGYTSNNGELCYYSPANSQVEVQVYSDCLGSVLLNEVIDMMPGVYVELNIPPSQDLETTTINAMVRTCVGGVVTNGYAYVFEATNNDFAAYTPININNGVINYDLLYCPNSTYRMMVYDNDTGFSTGVITLDLEPGSTNLGTLFACGNPTGGTFVGDVTLTTQEEVDLFGLFGYEVIQGELKVKGQLVNSLIPLNTIEKIFDRLVIENTHLTNLEGLNNLSSYGSSIPWVNILEISNNNQLTSIQGIGSVVTVPYIQMKILSNPLLGSLTGVNLIEIQFLEILNNDSLIDLEGVENIQSIEELHIKNNLLLSSLNGLENITMISDLEVGSANFPGQGNPSLIDFCALQSWLITGNFNTVNIHDNAFNPTVQDIIDGNCTQ